MRRMADSVTPMDIPVNDPRTGQPWDLVAGYIDGVPRWPAAAWDRFPGSIHVQIALDPATNGGHVLDVERGAANPDQAPGWVTRRRAAGADPTVYCNQSTWPAVQEQFIAAGVAAPHWWIARYDGVPQLLPGTVAKQYVNPPNSGGHLDLTVVADYWPGVDQGDGMDEQSIAKAVWDYTLTRDGQDPARAEEYETWDNEKSGAAEAAAESVLAKVDALAVKLDAVLAALKAGGGALPSGVLHVQGDVTIGPPAQ